MSATDRNSPPSPTSAAAAGRRRSSFTGQFIDLFGRSSSVSGGAGTQSAYPGPITEAAAQAQRRRLSLTTVGLSGSPNQNSPFTPARPRTESLSSANSGSVDESPFEEGDAPSSSVPTTPFARRLSFGARALRDVRTGSGSGTGNGNPRPSVSKKASGGSGSSRTTPPTASKKHGRVGGQQGGLDFAENLRSRAERSSISAASGVSSYAPASVPSAHSRTKSVAAMEQPVREIPKTPKVPDPIQERMLRGDFYMD